MLSLETSIQLCWNVNVSSGGINDLAAGLPGLGRELALEVGVQVLTQVQDEFLEKVFRGNAEVICCGCGVVHSGAEARLVRRGSRQRKLRVSSGVLCFPLRQVTCRECEKTWSPCIALLGLEPRQRFSQELERKLVEAVTNQSYAKTCRLAKEWLGSSISPRRLHACVQARGASLVFTAAPACKVVMADGTKVPAGKSRYGTDVRVAFQILGRSVKNGRSVVHKRIAGWSIGPVGWSAALPAGIASEVIVTDRAAGRNPLGPARRETGAVRAIREHGLGAEPSHAGDAARLARPYPVCEALARADDEPGRARDAGDQPQD